MAAVLLILLASLGFTAIARSDEPKVADEPVVAEADPDAPLTILYTIHNTGYVEPCG